MWDENWGFYNIYLLFYVLGLFKPFSDSTLLKLEPLVKPLRRVWGPVTAAFGSLLEMQILRPRAQVCGVLKVYFTLARLPCDRVYVKAYV